MTLTEKIMARAAGKKSVQPGDNVWVNVDVLMTHDVCGPGTIGVFKREVGKDAKVWDREKIVIIPDHYIITADSKSNRNVDILRDFVREQGLMEVGCGRLDGFGLPLVDRQLADKPENCRHVGRHGRPDGAVSLLVLAGFGMPCAHPLSLGQQMNPTSPP